MKHFFIIAILFIPVLLFGQNQEEVKNEVIEQRIEFLVEQAENENIDFTTVVDNLSYLYDHPLNLNFATRDELEQLELLSPFQIQGILAYVNQYGEMTTIYELRNIPQMNKTVIYQILPFVMVTSEEQREDFSLKDALKYGRNDLFLRSGRILEQQQGFAPISPEELAENPDRRFLGSPNFYYLRYRFQFGNKFSVGLTGNKRPGEEFFTGSNPYGFDFYSAHIFARDIGKVKQLAIGDYHAQFGQGLALWTGFGFRKTPNAMNVAKYSQKLRPYSSANENLFLRGAGVTVGGDNLTFTGFYSQKRVDANINTNDSLDAGTLEFSSLQQSGLHRTPNEVSNRRSITERIAGGNVTFEKGNFHLGATGVYFHYDGVFNRNLQLYNQFDLNTNETYTGSVDFNWMVGKINFFGEGAVSANGGTAYLAGAQFEPDPKVEMIIANRNYSKDYHSIYAIPFGESTRPQTERGTYIGTKLKLAPRLSLNGYVDFFRFDWMKFLIDAPSVGTDYLAQLDFSPARNINMYWRYRNRHKARNSRDPDLVIRYPVNERRQFLRYEIKYSPIKELQLGNRIEYSFYNLKGQDQQNGFIFYQDIRYKPAKSNFSFWARATLFDIDAWDARIYAFENDLLYFFSVPAFNNRGVRYYAMVKYEPARNLHFWLKVARTHYSNIDGTGNGLMRIDEPTRTEIRAQMRLKF